MTSDPLLERLRSQLRIRRLAGIKGAVTIKTAGTAYGERTVAQIDHPLLITALGTRADANATPDLYARSLALVWLLKRYAHAISERTNRGGYVDMDAANRPNVIAVLRQLGFHDAPRVNGFSPSGRHLRQDATGPH
jgi:hypothetical protein